MRKRFIVLTFVLIFVQFIDRPTVAYACDSLLCIGDILGYTDAGEQAKEIGDRDAARREQEAAVQAQRDMEIARINAQGDERLEIARGNNLREYMSGVADAQEIVGKYDLLKTSVNAVKDIKMKELDVLMQTQLSAIDGKVDVTKAQIKSTESTERNRSASRAVTQTTTIFLVAFAVAVIVISRRKGTRTESAQPITSVVAPSVAHSLETYRFLSEDQVIYIPQPKRVQMETKR